MASPTRRFLGGVVLFLTTDVVVRAILFVMSPVLTRLLTPAQYGGYSLLLSIAAVAALIQYTGMDAAFPFFRGRISSEREEGEVAATATTMATVGCVAVTLVALASFGTSWLERLTRLRTAELLTFALGLLPLGLLNWYLYVFRYRHETASFVRVNVIGLVVGPLAALPLMYTAPADRRLLVLLATTIAAQVIAIALAFREARAVRIPLYGHGFFSRPLARKMLAYGGRLVPAFVLYAICFHSGRFLLGWLSGPDAVSILAVAVTISSIALIVRTWFSFFWDPHLADWVTQKQPMDYLPRLQAAIPLLATAFFLIAALGAFWSDLVIRLLYPASYAPAAELIPWLLFAGGFAALSTVAIGTTLIASNPRYHLPVYTAALAIQIAVSVKLIPTMGGMGAVIAMVAGEVFILCAWVVIGRWMLRNLALNWTVAAMQAVLAAVAIAWHNPQATLIVSVVMIGIGAFALRSHRSLLLQVFGSRAEEPA